MTRPADHPKNNPTDTPADHRADDFDRGVKNRRAVLGDAWVDQSLNNANAFNAEFQSLITRYAWHDIWGRPGLDHTTRRLLVLGMTMGLARWAEFELHCRAAVRGGVQLALIKETLMQGAIYCGVPAANTAFKITTDILREQGLLPAPAPLSASTRVAVHHTFSQPQLAVALQGPAMQGLSIEGAAPIVLSHALGLDLTMWDDLAAQLSAADHPVLRYDHRGHGGSAVPVGPYSMDDLVDDAARLIREWGRGPVVWVGLSMGSMVRQGLAVRYPELIKALVLANTTSKHPAVAGAVFEERIGALRKGGMASIVDAVLARYFSVAFCALHAEAVAGFRAKVLKTDRGGYAACCAAVGGVDWMEQLDAVKCPTLIIAGALDIGTPPAMSQAMAEKITDAELVVFDQASHLSVIGQPAQFAVALRRFLARVG